MKAVLTILLWMVAAWGGADSLALVVHYDQGDVGEEHQVWTTSYYTNEEGRLVRKVVVIRGEYGDPDTTKERIYRWDKDGVHWFTNEDEALPLPRSLLFVGEGLVRTIGDASTKAPAWAGQPKTLRYLDPERTTWSDGGAINSWSRMVGFSKNYLSESGRNSAKTSGWRTSGASLVEWSLGVEQNRVILDRRPDRIHGIFLQQNEQLTGWDVTGELDVAGRGLWHRDPQIRLAHMSILDDDWNLAFAAPLVWTSDYLR